MTNSNRTHLRLNLFVALLALAAFGLASCDATPAQGQEADPTATPQVVATITKATVDPNAPTPEPVATFSPEVATDLADLGWITFTASDGGRRDVWLIRPDGSGEYNLTGGLQNTFAEAPVWSPDGSLIAYDGVPNSDVSRDVYLVTVNAEPETWQLTTQPGFDCYPSFSPDGQQIVIMAELDGNRDLFIVDLEGNEVRQLTDEAAYDYEPNWSPQGDKIAFVSRRDGNSEIYTMDTDGSHVVRLTDDAKLDWRPVFSPDGEWIVFESWRTGNGDIYLMRADGSDLQQLTTSPAEDGNPTWSPDGRYIVFHSQRTGNYQLFIMDVENPEEQWHLPTGSVRSLLPVWSPVTDVPGAGAVENN